MILNMFWPLVGLLTLGALNGVTSVAVSRSASSLSGPGFVSSNGNSSIVARMMSPYDTDPDFNPHLNVPDISSDELCARGKTLEDVDANSPGNWYCQKVDQILYTKITKPGTYQEVTFMDNQSGECRFSPREFKGDLAPYNEPLSIIFRGPLRLKQFSVYTPGGGGSSNRIGEYHAASQARNGIMFLGNRGGAGSGVAGGPFGASLSYVSADGLGGASGPQTIHDAPLVSHAEFVVTTDQPCDGSCGYRRPGAVTYKGFPGSARVFMFEFSMPDEPQHNGEAGGNEPAIWLLNSRIPNTAQYNTCNCWASGCGELDIFEILYPGQTKAISTFHLGGDGKSAGDANWLQRPTGGPIKLAVVMDATKGGTVSIKNMGASNGERFGGSLSASQVEGLKAKSGLVSEYVYPNH
ncbi:target of Sbf [Neurospora sp. IMI 360204]|nr:target of Sbf [Neurospora sp. IMI 360204]